MTKLQKLTEFISKAQLEAAAQIREAARTGNPHLSTRASGENMAYIKILQKIEELNKKTFAGVK